MGTAQIKRQSRLIQNDIEDDDALYETRTPSSARRYKATPPPEQDVQPKLVTRATRVTPAVKPTPQPKSAPLPQQDIVTQRDTDEDEDVEEQQDPITQGNPVLRRRSHLDSSKVQERTPRIVREKGTPITGALPAQRKFPLIPVLIGSVVTILLVMVLSALGSWWITYQNDLHYGRPRTSQLDAVVGHYDSSAHPTHFIFLNLNRHVEIIEISGGDDKHSHIYSGPTLYGDGQDLAPVTGQITDVNHDGKPDLIVHIGDQQIVYINDGTTFHQQ